MATKGNGARRKDSIPVRTKGQTKCPYHKDNDLVFVCQECQQLICTTCSITSHKNHIDSFLELSKFTNEHKRTLQEFVNVTEKTRIQKIKKEIQLTRNKILASESYYKNLSIDIKEQHDQCKQDLDRVMEEYLTICNTMEQVATDLLQTHIINLEDRLDTLEKLSAECKQTIQTGADVLVYDSVKEIKEMDLEIPKIPSIETTEFTPSSNRKNHLKQAIGELKTSIDHFQAESVPTENSKKGPVAKRKQSKSSEMTESTPGNKRQREVKKVNGKVNTDHLQEDSSPSDNSKQAPAVRRKQSKITEIAELTPRNRRQSQLEQAMGKMNTPIDQLKEESLSNGNSKQGPVVRQKPSKPADMPELTPRNNKQSHVEQAAGKTKKDTDLTKEAPATGGSPRQDSIARTKKPKWESGKAFAGEVPYKIRDVPIVLSQFSYTGRIRSICPTPDGRAWLVDYDTNTVNFTNNTGQVIQKINHTSSIRRVSLDPTTGSLWFCCINDKTINEVAIPSAPVTRFTTELHPYSLCVTRDGQILVGTQGKKGYKVVVYTTDGEVQHSATVEVSGTGLVQSITQCGITGNIAVVNSKLISGDGSDPNDYKRHIIVYNSTLHPLVHYRGQGITEQGTERFDPLEVAYDSRGNFIVADRTRNTIDLMSGSGKYIKSYRPSKGRQRTVGIQDDDVLWSVIVLENGKMLFKLLKYYND